MISDYLARPSRQVRNIKQVMASSALDPLSKELIYVAASVDGATGASARVWLKLRTGLGKCIQCQAGFFDAADGRERL